MHFSIKTDLFTSQFQALISTSSALKVPIEGKIHKHTSWCHLEKQLDVKDVSFKIDDVLTWLTNNCNTRIDQYLTKYIQRGNEMWSLNRITGETFFTKNYPENVVEKLPRPYSKNSKLSISLDQKF